ncbi:MULTISPECIES: cell division protein ZapE [Rhodococcus]|uniref:cell division protein ZapE n=1 Tax=Rhodococcus TaxID=1827 RepID=UPI0022A84043|nr:MULTISPECIES: cell division protein ZapE [Rhodococcus]MCZ1073140.1 cell division protein ZapE [Rhodococcus sp. A5(2022)]MDO2377265.1 cell division protein ZapE [Rhodococcus ruber]
MTVDDPHQRAGAEALHRLGGDLAARRASPSGVYLWGPVGRGKTWLMDRFLETVPVPARRHHFHGFFTALHAHAHRLGSIDDAVDAAVGDARVLCFDEFHVHDIGDGMLVARAVRTLLGRGVALVATSNYPPSGLLPNPLFHHLFEPTIVLLERRMEVVEVGGPIDRRRTAAPAPDGGFGSGEFLSPGVLDLPEPGERRTLRPSGRALPALAVRGGVVWFDFADLCCAPTAPADYLAVLRDHREWIVTGVPPLREVDPDALRRFGNVVDVLCDAGARLTVCATVARADFATSVPAEPDVDRLLSRLALLREPARVWIQDSQTL